MDESLHQEKPRNFHYSSKATPKLTKRRRSKILETGEGPDANGTEIEHRAAS